MFGLYCLHSTSQSRRGKPVYMLPQKHVNLIWPKKLKREFGNRTWVAKSKKLSILSFLCRYLSALYEFHKWDNLKYATNINWDLAENVLL